MRDPFYDELPERLARKHRPRRPWREFVTPQAGRVAALVTVIVAVVAGIWIWLAWPPSVPETNAHLEDFCSDSESVFDESPRLDATDSPSIVFWIDRETRPYELLDGSELEESEPNPGYPSTEMRAVELIACGTIESGEHVEVCKYPDPVGEKNMHTVVYQFTVYEAATHERVGEVAVENSREPSLEDDENIDAVPDPWGSDILREICPMWMSTDIAVILLEPTLDATNQALASFVAGQTEG